MIQLPPEYLLEQFNRFLRRGVVFRFVVEDFDDPTRRPGPKFGVVLNVDLPTEDVLYVFASSKLGFYEANPQFDAVLLNIDPGTYDCFHVRTVFPFKDVRSVRVAMLQQQYLTGHLTFPCQLTIEHVREMDRLIRGSRFISPRSKRLIVPLKDGPAPGA